jgi:hypothetical protein
MLVSSTVCQNKVVDRSITSNFLAGIEFYCANGDVGKTKLDSDCSMPCAGETTKKGGGEYWLDVYSFTLCCTRLSCYAEGPTRVLQGQEVTSSSNSSNFWIVQWEASNELVLIVVDCSSLVWRGTAPDRLPQWRCLVWSSPALTNFPLPPPLQLPSLR